MATSNTPTKGASLDSTTHGEKNMEHPMKGVPKAKVEVIIQRLQQMLIRYTATHEMFLDLAVIVGREYRSQDERVHAVEEKLLQWKKDGLLELKGSITCYDCLFRRCVSMLGAPGASVDHFTGDVRRVHIHGFRYRRRIKLHLRIPKTLKSPYSTPFVGVPRNEWRQPEVDVPVCAVLPHTVRAGLEARSSPMARSTYGRDAFESFRITVLVGIIVSSFFFAFVHSVDRVLYTPAVLRPNSRLLKNAIVVANWGVICTIVPFFLTCNIVSPDDSPEVCRWLHLWGLVSYVIVNFFFYRVLVFKSQAYDVMSEYPKMYFYVYWAVHILCPFLTVGATSLHAIGNYKIITENIAGGNRLCIVDGFKYIEFLSKESVSAFFAAFTDLAISLGCLSLLVLPLLKPGFNPKGNIGVVRNVVFSSIAILSTFTILLLMAIFEFKDGYWTCGLVIDLGCTDLLLNIVCINLCWPVKFYLKTIRRMYQSAFGSTSAATMSSRMTRKPPPMSPKAKDGRILSQKSNKSPRVMRKASTDSKTIGLSPRSSPRISTPAAARPSSGYWSKSNAKSLAECPLTRSPTKIGSFSRK
ncbi:hypothetical protein AAMO2058_001714300 [Amorphochlora amoebiformis]